MARHDKFVEIKADKEKNRDAGKVFYIREMSAFAGDWWAKRAILAISKVDLDLGKLEGIENAGMMGVAAIGMQFLSSIRPEDAKPLFDELMACISYVPDPTRMDVRRPIGAGGADDIEEISTISFLQAEAFSLHINFSDLVAGLKSMIERATAKVEALQNT